MNRPKEVMQAELNASLRMPIAGGEGLPGLHDFFRACQQNVYDVLQPEVLVVQGATAMRKIGSCSTSRNGE